MDIFAVAGMIAAGAAEIAKLANEAIEASRAGNENDALALLDAALARFDSGASTARFELEAIKARIEEKIKAKFPPSGAV